MIDALYLALGLAWLLAACGPAERPAVPRRVDAACRLMEHRCTRCHPLDRVLGVEVTEPAQWRSYVGRMRRQPGSGISPSDGDVIVECLVQRYLRAAQPGETGSVQ